ncbi:MAG TPA: hypothetical protein VF720_12680 [Candidatus Eisenbacteria bacterium]
MTQELLLSAVLAIWLIPFLFGGHFRLGATHGRRSLLSAAAGIAVGYVFIDLLPEMARLQEEFTTAAAGLGRPFFRYRVYSSAMIGFVFFFVLENMVVSARAEARSPEAGENAMYWAHLMGFTAYGGLMSYLLWAEEEFDPAGLALYSLAMFLHFWTVDHSLREEHGARYDRYGRWVVVAGLVAGALVGGRGVTSELWVPTIMGFIGGGVVINSLKDELPGRGEGRAMPFVLGAFGYSLLLLVLGTRH